MTVAELIDALRAYPSDAVVYIYDVTADYATGAFKVEESADAPNEEVYIAVEIT